MTLTPKGMDERFLVAIVASKIYYPEMDSKHICFVRAVPLSRRGLEGSVSFELSELLFSPTLVTGIERNELLHEVDVESVSEIKLPKDLPDYKTPWPPYRAFSGMSGRWKVFPNYDFRLARVVGDDVTLRRLDYAGTIGIEDFALKIKYYHLLRSDWLAARRQFREEVISDYQREMLDAILDDNKPK